MLYMHYPCCVLSFPWLLQCISLSSMELVRQISFPYVLPKQFKGCILVFEYSYFLLQQNGDTRNTLNLAVEKYQSSGTRATVLSALQHAINEYSNDYDVLMQAIIDIIVDNCMCK